MLLTMLKKIIFTILCLSIVIFVGITLVLNHHQDINLHEVLNQNLDGRLIPHKANTKNKLKHILRKGIRSFEFDTVFNTRSAQPFFEIGHDDSETKGTSFEDYLEIVKDQSIQKIWMDIKNLNDKNISQVLSRLNELDQKYQLKSKLIFEHQSLSPQVQQISLAGYHTSYYLPVTALKALSENRIVEVKKEAQRIKIQIQAQQLKAISFETPMYPFVKTYLEPLISKEIVYHTWFIYKFKNKDELTKIQNEDFYKDPRIKTIIYSFYNRNIYQLFDF